MYVCMYVCMYACMYMERDPHKATDVSKLFKPTTSHFITAVIDAISGKFGGDALKSEARVQVLLHTHTHTHTHTHKCTRKQKHTLNPKPQSLQRRL